MHTATGGSPVYRYEFDQAPPMAADDKGESRGAYHSAEIEFVFRALPSKNLPWSAEDTKLSDLMGRIGPTSRRPAIRTDQDCPNGRFTTPTAIMKSCILSTATPSRRRTNRARYEFLDSLSSAR